MKNNKPAKETANQQNDDQQAQLADLPVKEAQETDVRGGAAGVIKSRETDVKVKMVGGSGNDNYLWDPGNLTV